MPSWCISQSGDSARSRSTLVATSSITKSISASVLKRPMPNRIEVCASSSPTPSARST
jgi:hypothetical protein